MNNSTWRCIKINTCNIRRGQSSQIGIVILSASEEVGKQFVQDVLHQEVVKRPDLGAKVNTTYVIGEAKWIGQLGGNQEKQVSEVIGFCQNQRGRVRRVGIVDGFPWAVYNIRDRIFNNKEVVSIQECEYDMLNALLLDEYLHSLIHPSPTSTTK